MEADSKYKIKLQKDGKYAILMKKSNSEGLTIHSTHDTYEDANDELTDIRHKPSQYETMKFLGDLKDSLKNI